MLAVGLLVVIANVVLSLVRGPQAGDDPWRANTLEWATSSPPPPYNFVTLPVVRSADPNWDANGRDAEGRDLVLADGRQTVATSELDADLEAALRMPAESIWPLALAASIAVIFVGLITGATPVSWAGVGLAALALAGWHRRPPAEPLPVGSETTLERATGWWGMWLLIATEASLFALLVASYFYLRFRSNSGWPPSGIGDPSIPGPLLATAILVLSSVPIEFAARAGRGVVRIGAVLTAIALAIVFIVLQAMLVSDSLDRFRPHDGAYPSIFYALVGLHAAHVVVGIAIAAWACVLAASGAARLPLRVTALYWHFVNVVALIVFATLYLSPRA